MGSMKKLFGGWGVVYEPPARARVRLCCFPHAGGGASFFRSWTQDLLADIEVCAIQPPGREDRLHEPAFSDIPTLVDKLMEIVVPSLQPPYAFFGHSMGAAIGFELAQRLKRERLPAPVHLFVSGREAPHLPDPEPQVYHLPDAEFVEALRGLGGTPEAVFENQELLQLLLPGIRADFTASQAYRYRPGEPLDCPISACGGLGDPHVKQEHLEGWQEHTTGPFAVRLFQGDHFYIQSDRVPLLQWIRASLAPYLVSARAARGR